MKKEFDHWKTLSTCYEQGSLIYVDLAFAQCILKKLGSDQEEHAALLATLCALSRKGHLTLDISPNSLALALQILTVRDKKRMSDLIEQGALHFPIHGIADNPTLPCNVWLCRFKTFYYLQKNWVYETQILMHLNRLHGQAPSLEISIDEMDPCLNREQKQAIAKAVQYSVSLLTGGPGTGKTFTASELVKTCISSLDEKQKEQFRIILTAPTGKAATQLEGNLRKNFGMHIQLCSGTLHSILGIRENNFEEETLPLFADLIIVDECSMIDAKIFSRLLSSIQEGTRLILIGDKNQLPAVEAGSVFADLLDAEIYPATHLTECLRSDRLEILTLAQNIQEGNAQAALEFLEKNPDIKWIDLEEKEKVPSQFLADLWCEYKDRFPDFFTVEPSSEEILSHLGTFNILSCMRQGPLGANAFNHYFIGQYLKNASPNSWWVAPIMITRNDYELELYNGDLGFLVRKITPDFSLKQLHIDNYAIFQSRNGGLKRISALALPAFEYSYCLSVHKSQGSEYNEVLILFPTGSELFGREVLYTAVTRAKRKVSLAGNRELLLQAIHAKSRKTSGIPVRLSERV